MSNTTSWPRACITGIGAITPFGIGWEAITAQLARGAPIYETWNPALEPPFRGARLGVVRSFPKERWFEERQLRLMDKSMALSSVAAALALEDADLFEDGQVAERDQVGTILASAQGETASTCRFGSPLFQADRKPVNPAYFPMIARNVACGQLSIRFGLRGWSSMIAAGPAAGAHAVARAVDMISTGRANAIVVGAYEVLSPMMLHQWKQRRREQASTGAVLDASSNEWVPVEGACVFVVESEQHAARRGRRAHAVFEHCAHGYSQGDSGQGWPALIDRFMARVPSTDSARGGLRVSCTSASDGTDRHGAAVRAFEATVDRVCGTRIEARTRPLFGDAQSVDAVWGVALACHKLATAAARADAGQAIVTSLTDKGSYALFALKSA